MISFDYNPQTNEILRKIEGIKIPKVVKGEKRKQLVWSCPLTLDAVKKLHQAGFTFCPELKKWEASLFKKVEFDPHFVVPELKNWDLLETYQKQGIQFIEAKKGRCLIADDPGLGKTVQALGWYQLHRKELSPTLIICPANAKWTWHDEAHFWLHNPNVQIITGTAEVEITGELVVINYDVLTQTIDGKDVFRKDIWSVGWKCLLLDEGHYCTNPDSIRGWAVQQMTRRIQHVVIITATPGDKNRQKFYLAQMIDSRIFPSFFKFAHRYCDAKKGWKGIWDFNGSSNEEELHALLASTIMIRRTKEGVFTNFPAIVREVVPLQINNQAEYDLAENDFGAWSKKHGKTIKDESAALQKIEALTQLAVKGKLAAAIEWIKELLKTSKKLIVFADHISTIQALERAFPGITATIAGDTSDKKRNDAKNDFQRCKRCGIRKERHDVTLDACGKYIYDMNKRILLATKAGKEAATLTTAYDVVFLELWWTGDDHIQAEGRAFGRRGDLHGGTAWYLIAHGTVEGYKAKLLDVKNGINQKVMNGKTIGKEKLLTELIKHYKEK